MQDHNSVRMGDGERVLMSPGQITEDLLAGTRDAAQRADIAALTSDELEQLFDIFADPSRIVSALPGQEVIVTDDAVCILFYLDQDNSGQGIPMSRGQSVLAYERACAADTVSIGHTDCSYKQVKPIINFEKQEYHSASLMTTAPFFYGSQPNMGLYFQPDGPYPNPADLLPMRKICEAQEAQQDAAEHLRKDMVFISRRLSVDLFRSKIE